MVASPKVNAVTADIQLDHMAHESPQDISGSNSHQSPWGPDSGAECGGKNSYLGCSFFLFAPCRVKVRAKVSILVVFSGKSASF